MKRLGFQETDVSFRWHRSQAIGLTVEFFCPTGAQRPAGRTFRPAQRDNPIAKHSFGGKLSSLALEAGELLTTDIETINRTLVLPRNKGTLDVQLHVTGPLAFLSAKIDALRGRDKPKDALRHRLAHRELLSAARAGLVRWAIRRVWTRSTLQ